MIRSTVIRAKHMPIGGSSFGVRHRIKPVELWLEAQGERIGCLPAETDLQPGAQVEFAGQTYAVLERRHRYQFQAGQYRLWQVVLQVQPLSTAEERSWLAGDWVLGNVNCQFNARSQLVRCAVNPTGPCQNCPDYEPIATESPSDSPTSSRAPLAKSQPD